MTASSRLFTFFNSFLFWAAWICIPLLMEIIPSIGSIFLLGKRGLKGKRGHKEPEFYPQITLIIPVYNSESTLRACIDSVDRSSYPNGQIRLFLVNNHSADDSFSVYAQCQEAYPDLIMQWLNAEQGKSRALNMALYNSGGKYVIHIDSDGVLEEHALANMVARFERDATVNCMTGAILTRPERIEACPRGRRRFFRKLEFMEYAQAFLAGRNYASEMKFLYTLSGAFAAFRSSSIMDSWLFNTETVSEDTEITLQMRYNLKERLQLCEDALFFVEPIRDVDELYTQRQRWQRGSLEVAHMFAGESLSIRHALSDVVVHTLLYDHTFAFPRMIWYLALICLLFIGYSGKTVLWATGLIFLLYILMGYLYFAAVSRFLREFPQTRRYYRRQWWVVVFLPAYNLLVFFIRMAGIINSIGTNSVWRTRTLSEEADALGDTLRGDLSGVTGRFRRAWDWVNGGGTARD